MNSFMVTDLFALDTLCEMLDSPLRLLNYLHLRDLFAGKLAFNHEIVLLGFHLHRNLWLDDGYDYGVLEDGLAADLEAAMVVRRLGMPGPRTPQGILTRLQDSPLTKVIEQLAREPQAAALGLLLLRMGEDSHRSLSASLLNLATLTRRDRKHHDFSFPLGEEGLGDGKISGALARCAGTGGFSNYKARVTGTYSHNNFSVTNEMPVAGITVRTKLKGRRIGSCPPSQLQGQIWQEDRHRKLTAREREVLTGPATLP